MKKCLYIILSFLLLLTGCSQGQNDIASSSSKNNDTVNSSNNSNNSSKKADLIKQLESDHFIFFSKEEDKNCLKDLSLTLEDNYARVINDLHASINKKVRVCIYSDLNTFHRAINQPDAPSWVVGNAVPGDDVIQMVNPSNADGRPYTDFMKIIVHEFTHIVVMSINPSKNSIPIWLNEGIALYEAKQDDGVERVFSNAESSNNFPTLKDLETDMYTFGNNNGYSFSYSIVDYIIKVYGYDKLVALIKSPSEFEKILGITKEDFQKDWIAH